MRLFHALPVLLLAAALSAQGQTHAPTPEVEAALAGGPSEATVRGWAEQSYPGLLKSASLPSGLVLGFVVTPEYKIVRHSATIQRMVPVTEDMERMFVPLSFPRGTTGGADCFPAAAGSPQFCVYWAVASAAQAGQ